MGMVSTPPEPGTPDTRPPMVSRPRGCGKAGRGQEAGANSSPRRRAPGDTLDLTNREYRGSAFELYKKPGYSIPSTYTGDVSR